MLLEVNNSSLSPQSYRKSARENYQKLLEYCVKYQVPVVMDSDAHVDFMAGEHTFAIQLLERLGFPEELVLNGNSEMFCEYINLK